MRRLVVLALITSAVLAVPIGLVRLASRGDGSNPFALMFTAPDGSPCPQPCMFGVRPGQTNFHDAIGILKAHPLTRNLRETDDILRNGVVFGGNPLSVGLSRDDNGRLVMVDVQVAPPPVGSPMPLPLSGFKAASFAQMIMSLGIPDYVGFGTDMLGSTVDSFYQALNLHVVHVAGPDLRIDPDLPLRYVFMYIRSADVTPQLFPWMGFASASRYLNTRAALLR